MNEQLFKKLKRETILALVVASVFGWLETGVERTHSLQYDPRYAEHRSVTPTSMYVASTIVIGGLFTALWAYVIHTERRCLITFLMVCQVIVATLGPFVRFFYCSTLLSPMPPAHLVIHSISSILAIILAIYFVRLHRALRDIRRNGLDGASVYGHARLAVPVNIVTAQQQQQLFQPQPQQQQTAYPVQPMPSNNAMMPPPYESVHQPLTYNQPPLPPQHQVVHIHQSQLANLGLGQGGGSNGGSGAQVLLLKDGKYQQLS